MLEVHGHEGLQALSAGMLDGLGKVRALLVAVTDDMAVQGTAQRRGAVLADPAAGNEALQGRGSRHRVSSGFR
ncbi:hypothetical protein D3C79_1038400 [compost metagenome]